MASLNQKASPCGWWKLGELCPPGTEWVELPTTEQFCFTEDFVSRDPERIQVRFRGRVEMEDDYLFSNNRSCRPLKDLNSPA